MLTQMSRVVVALLKHNARQVELYLSKSINLNL